MTKPTPSRPVIDMTQITQNHRQQIDRVVQIGAAIGLAQQKKHDEILKAITRNFDAMIGVIDDATRKLVFDVLVEVANATDAKRIRLHPGFIRGAEDGSRSSPGERTDQQKPFRSNDDLPSTHNGTSE